MIPSVAKSTGQRSLIELFDCLNVEILPSGSHITKKSTLADDYLTHCGKIAIGIISAFQTSPCLLSNLPAGVGIYFPLEGGNTQDQFVVQGNSES